MRTFLTATLFLINVIAIAQDRSAIICGHYHNTSTEAISIEVSNLLDEHTTNYLSFIDAKTGKFRFEFPITTTQEVILKSESKLNLILSPGDSLFIKFDKNGTVQSSGASSKVNQEILNYTLIKNKESFMPNCDGKTLKEYKNELSIWTQKELKELQEFKAKNNCSELFETWTKNDILYGNANYLINYAVYRQMNNLPSEKGLMENQIFPADNDRALISFNYRIHLYEYLVFKYRFEDLLPKKQEDYEGFKNLQNRFDSLIANESQTKSRDVLVIDLFNMLVGKGINDAIIFINHNINKIQDSELRESFRKRIETFKTTNHSVTFLGKENSDSKIVGDIFKDMTERFQGKVIYIDFWATWCGPCRIEFPHSISLDNFFSDQDVAFVYVCMNSEMEKWKSSVKNLKLNQNQYFLNEVESKVFRQKFQIYGFPTYYLIDKTGQLINKDAPRPSSEDIKDKIQALLK